VIVEPHIARHDKDVTRISKRLCSENEMTTENDSVNKYYGGTTRPTA